MLHASFHWALDKSQEYSHEANQEILRKRFKFKGLGKFIKMV